LPDLGASLRSAKHKMATRERLNKSLSKRVLTLVMLVGTIEKLVTESGTPDNFDAPQWMARWLTAPSAALRNVAPSTYMDTSFGRAILVQIIRQSQSGVYV
jgi:hypothetical protein